jgi:O-antigen ligase
MSMPVIIVPMLIIIVTIITSINTMLVIISIIITFPALKKICLPTKQATFTLIIVFFMLQMRNFSRKYLIQKEYLKVLVLSTLFLAVSLRSPAFLRWAQDWL